MYRRDGDVYRVVANRGFSEEYVQFIRIIRFPLAVGPALGGRTHGAVVHMPDAQPTPNTLGPESTEDWWLPYDAWSAAGARGLPDRCHLTDANDGEAL